MAYRNRRKKSRSFVIAVAVIALLLITATAVMKSENKANHAPSVLKIFKSPHQYTNAPGDFMHMENTEPIDGIDTLGVVMKKMPGFSVSSQSEQSQGIDGKYKINIPFMDLTDIENDPDALEKMIRRKETLGIQTSLDLVVRSNETFELGGTTISMKEILEKIHLKKGELFEENIDDTGQIGQKTITEYGIYVVQPGDNIWNIHYKIIKEFFTNRGVHVSEMADEPLVTGESSGVGKLLKFSETMVFIYNLLEHRIDSNINLLKPLSKIVIYNMNEVFSLLNKIDFEYVDEIRFDGHTIWIPAKKCTKLKTH